MASSLQPAIPQAEPASASPLQHSSPIQRAQKQLKGLENKETMSVATSGSAARSTRAKSSQSTADVPSTNGTNADESTAMQKVIDPTNPTPWKHPDELPYIRREDWSQDLMLEYLIQKSFSIPPRDNASSPLIEILPKEAPPVTIPRKYRVPLMFLAKFQWESLRLVLNAADPTTEWHEFKFDIIHITRLCQHLFNQAKDAKEKGGPKGLDRMWRSPMFDRVLTRFYHHWFISRDWFLKHFYEEFEEEEYHNDVLRNDWSRWALKGHKGFRLTKTEIQNGITAEQFMRGLGRNADGVWTWTADPTMSESSATAAPLSNEPASPPASENMDAITNVAPANNSMKREHLEAGAFNLPEQSSNHASEAVVSIPTPPPTSNPSSPPIAQVVIATENLSSSTSPIQVTPSLVNNIVVPAPNALETSSQPPATVATVAVVAPSTSDGVNSVAPVSPTSTASKELSSESKTVKDAAQPAQLSIHVSQNTTPVGDKVVAETEKMVEPITISLQSTAMSKENIAIPNSQVAFDTSAQLAGTKRTHDDADSPINASPSRKRNQAQTARRSLAEAYRYGQVTSTKLSTPQKSPVKAIKPSVTDAATEGSTEGSSNSEKLAIKLKRVPASVTSPPPLKRKRFNGHPDSNADSSISAALSRHSRTLSSKKRSRRSSAVRILSGALATPATAGEESASVAKTDELFKLPANALSSSTSNNIASSTYNVSSAAFLIPTNPKQNMLSYVNGSALQRSSASPIIPAVNPSGTSAEVPKNSVGIPVISDGVHEAKSITPKPLVHQAGIATEATPTVSERSQIVSKASESIIAHGLLDVGRPSSTASDTNEDTVPSVTPTAHSQTVIMPLDEKGTPKSQYAVAAVNGNTNHQNTSQGNTAASVTGPGTNIDASSVKSTQITLPPTIASPILPTSTAIASLIRETLPDSQGNGSKEERMIIDVDEQLKSPSNTSRDRSLAAEQSVGLLMAQDTRAKSLHTILLLRDLLEFLCSRTQTSTSPQSPSWHELHNILDSRMRRMILNEEEAITIDQRLDVLAHASVALAKVLYPYRGAELEKRIIALDKRLQQQFDMVWTRDQQLTAAQQLRARALPDKEVQTSTLTISRGVQTLAEAVTISGGSISATQAVQTSSVLENKILINSGIQTEDIEALLLTSSTERQFTSLSSDVTMVDLSADDPHALEMGKPALLSNASRRSEPVAKIMMAIMRNMADLLECSTREDGATISKSGKGKEREIDTSDVRMQISDGFGDSPIVSTIMNEFKTMKDEMRITDWVREEMQSMSSLHATEVNSLKQEIKKGKEELEDTKRRYQVQIDNLNIALQMAKKGKGRLEMLDEEERVQAAELQELKRRISSLESRNRYSVVGGESISAASHGSPAPPTPTELVPARWSSHSLTHLPGQDSRNAPSPSPVAYVREHSSKPGTPVSGAPPLYARSVDRADSEEAVPLPAKSQRKKNVFYFPRGPV